MSDIFLHNPQNKLSQELADSFNENVNVLDYTDEVNNLKASLDANIVEQITPTVETKTLS